MENRIPHHLKGKEIDRGYSLPPRKRIRAPDLDTSDLIAANSLTLMGRLTNPSSQRLWSLFPFLSNRWNLRGKAIGSDLGKGCFQFKFDYEEDLQKVLDNRPYHYDQWMVILQRWEPVISDSFPSMIPFWIEIQGLPKLFWQPEMLTTIGEELGDIMDMEITSSTAKIRVLINGLQPLTKETNVDFPDGSEALISLEYKNLKNHCHHCLRLSHETKNYPGIAKTTEKAKPTSLAEGSHDSRGGSRNYYTPRDNFTAPQRFHRDSASSAFSQEATNNLKRNYDRMEGKNTHPSAERSQSHRGARNIPERSQHHHRAHYKPHGTSRSSSQSDRLHTSGNPHWREKSPLPTQIHRSSELSKSRRPPLERSSLNSDPQTPPPPPLCRHGSLEATSLGVPIPSKDQVLGELRDVTVQYITCADPTESAARR